jgi:hypothetical protein
MPFGNSVVMPSDDFQLPRSFDRVRLQEPGPLSYRLPHGPRVGARATGSGERAPHERLTAGHDLLLLFLGEQVFDRPQGEPQRADNGEHDAELDAQHGSLAVRGARAFARQQRRNHDDGSDFLRAGFDRMALQHVGLAHHPFGIAEVELVLPARGVQLREIERRRRPGIQQTRTRTLRWTSRLPSGSVLRTRALMVRGTRKRK